MQTPKVSVIVPVYNTEAFVEAAVRSVTEQTLAQIEILITDDGSTDGSPAILARLAAEDPRIHIHTQPNKGLSEARNAGLARAAGRYVYFMDSDDLLEADAMELCYERCEREHLDMLLFDADTFGADTAGNPWFDYHRAGAFGSKTYSGTEIFDGMFDRRKYIASACLYLIRREFITAHGFSFYPGILHEDELFTTRALLCAERAGCIDRAFFKRRLRPDSIMGSRFSERNLQGYMTVFAELSRFATTRNAETRRLLGRYLRYTINPVLRNAWALPANVRINTASKVITQYFRCLDPKSLATLLLKKPLKKLSGR